MPAPTSVNPATGEVLARFEEHTEAEVERRLSRAVEVFRVWRRRPVAERAHLAARAAEALEAGKERYGRIMTAEMGKTLKSAVAEVEKCAWACRYYAEQGARFLADEEVKTEAPRSYRRFLPLGPVLAVMPWNFPFWQVFRFAAPAVVAGNVGLLKHASSVPQCALAIEEVFRLAGFPDGVFQTLLVGADRVERIVSDPRVVAATLTGSEGAGMALAAAAGRALKKTVLELGGSDAFVVMPSAELAQAVQTAIAARIVNAGQSCIAAKRFVVHDEIHDRFVQGMVEGMRALQVGDPLDPETDIGPMASTAERDRLAAQVDALVRDGARAVTGGKPQPGPGAFYPPTVLVDVPRGSPTYREELFGPVALVVRVRSLDEAIDVANEVPYGLGSAAWTEDPAERARFVDELEAGMTVLNGMVISDPRLPFGGVKRSGYGRELSREGIREFVNVKTVVVQREPRQPGGARTE
ncbi:MAG TPA: NAD-dependent succinate-semialdehyde dehydrogenase [Anaeromyxobacter sp.]|nr:NAD-dependent succinate-semialdehyde dehydrogenase [Anaeromyxobacter sp.]